MRVLARLRILPDAAQHDASSASNGARDDPLHPVAAQPSFFDRAATGAEAEP
jgi:hypothetical protein